MNNTITNKPGPSLAWLFYAGLLLLLLATLPLSPAGSEAPELSPWHLLNETGNPIPVVTAGKAVFYPEGLRHF